MTLSRPITLSIPGTLSIPEKLSIIVPVLNESAGLPALMARLLPLQRNGAEVIFVDGDSHDGSASLAERAGFRVIQSPRGRALQMNAGAAIARGEHLLFLHADTHLPDDALRLIDAALSGKGYAWGRFNVRISGRFTLLRVVAAMMNLRSRLTGIATGDQAIFVRRDVFEQVGGFPEQPLMEDVELSKRLLRYSRPACLDQRVLTSGRRWEQHGVWRTIFFMWRLRWAYWRGVPAEHLAKVYQ